MTRAQTRVRGPRLRKSAVSIPSNIAEGFSRHSRPAYIQHLWYAHGSGAELETQIEIGQRVELVSVRTGDILMADLEEIGRMVNGLVRSLERSTPER